MILRGYPWIYPYPWMPQSSVLESCMVTRTSPHSNRHRCSCPYPHFITTGLAPSPARPRRVCPHPHPVPTVPIRIPIPVPVIQNFLTQPTSHQLVLFSSGRMFAWHLSFTWHQIQLVHSLQYCTTVSGAARILWQGGSEVWVYSGSRVRSPPVPVVLSVYQRGFFARRPCNVFVVWYEEVPWQWKHTHIT